MKAIITSEDSFTWDGQQAVTFDVADDNGNFLITHSIQGDVDQIEDSIKDFLREFKKKVKSKKRVKVGDSWEV